MTTVRRARATWIGLLALALASAAACSLNPQPIPPGSQESSAGPGGPFPGGDASIQKTTDDAGNQDGTGSGLDAGSVGPVTPVPSDAGADGLAQGAGDGSTTGPNADAATDASDASMDAPLD